jgi:hypothetical protein
MYNHLPEETDLTNPVHAGKICAVCGSQLHMTSKVVTLSLIL